MRGDRGAAIVFVVLLAVAFFALGHGLLVVALAEGAASRAAVRSLEARAAADGAIHATLRRPWNSWLDTLAVGEWGEATALRLGRVEARARARRLGPEAWLLEGAALVGSRVAARTARLGWAPELLTRLAALGGVLNAPQEAVWSLSGAVDTSRPAVAAPPLEPEHCAPWAAELEARQGVSPLAPVAVLPDTVGGPGLGRLDFNALLRVAEIRVGGAGTPGPAESWGTCVAEAPWGWGDPDNPGRPCGPHLPLRAAEGELTVMGGVGQGILVVGGDLTLTARARYYGLVIVRGALFVQGGARLEGLALTGGGGDVAAGAEVVGSTCWAARALAAHRSSLGRVIAVPGVGPIGPL